MVNMSGMLPEISILVPIYNVEEYLNECLTSLTNQTMNNIEIICLNDGSTDNSLSIVKQFAKKDNRIVVVDKKNSGYGDTMNLGIKKARGEYIGIVESDDFVDLEMFQSLYDIALKKDKPDIVKSNFYYYFTDLTEQSNLWDASIGGVWSDGLSQTIHDHNIKENVIPKYMHDKVVCPRRNYNEIFYALPSIWSAIYRTDFLRDNAIQFLSTPGASYQDVGFAFKTVLMADRVAFTSQAYLHYRQDNEESSVNNPDKAMYIIDEQHSISQYIIDHNMDSSKMRKIANLIKFNKYKWSLRRLPLKLALQFLPIMSKEFKKDRAEKNINWYLINETDTRVLNEIIDNPKMYTRRLKAQAKAKVSIVVPVYNVEDYIEKCIDSIINQTMGEIEIICVDDGCQDRSIELIEKYWKSDPRITIVHESNRGLAGARNYGMHSSHAKYVMFCDSDDYYEPKICQKMYEAINQNNTDLAICGIKMSYSSGYDKYRNDRLYYDLKFIGKHDITKDVLEMTDVSACNKIFRQSFIKKYDLHFPEGLLYEDYYFTKSYMLLSKSIYFIDEKLYNYVRRSNSIMVSTFSGYNRALDHMRVYLWLFDDYIIKYNLIDDKADYFINEFCAMFSFSKKYGRSQDYNDLYFMVKHFLDKYKWYLDKQDDSIYPRIKQLIPSRSLVIKIKDRLKSIYKKHSPNYRRYNTLNNRISEIDIKLSKSASDFSQQLSQIKNKKEK